MHTLEVHEGTAADEHLFAVDKRRQAAALVAGEGVDRHERTVVALHEIGEHGGEAAAGGDDHAAGVGDDLVRERTVEDADVLDGDVARGEQILIRHDQMLAAADVARTVPAGDRAAGLGEPARGRPERDGERDERRKRRARRGDGGEHVQDVGIAAAEDRGKQAEDHGRGDEIRRKSGIDRVGRAGLFAAVDEARRVALGLEHGDAVLDDLTVRADGVGILVDGERAERVLEATAGVQRAPQAAGDGKRGHGAKRQTHGVRAGDGQHDRIQRGKDTVEKYERFQPRRAAHEVEKAVGDHVQTDEHHGQLHHQAHERGDGRAAPEHAEHRQTERDVDQRDAHEHGRAAAKAQGFDLPAVILCGILRARLGAELLLGAGRSVHGAVVCAHAVGHGSQPRHERVEHRVLKAAAGGRIVLVARVASRAGIGRVAALRAFLGDGLKHTRRLFRLGLGVIQALRHLRRGGDGDGCILLRQVVLGLDRLIRHDLRELGGEALEP